MPTRWGNDGQLRGAVFEALVRHWAAAAGYAPIDIPVPPLGERQLYGLNGLPMVHGLGEGHNADVLLEYPVRLALTPHMRLLVECKGYGAAVGLPIVRGALGLRTDINAFRQLSDAELQRRAAARRPAGNPERHPYYHVAVASLFGFSEPAQSYAAAHHIELLDYSGLPLLGGLAEIVSGLKVDRFRPPDDGGNGEGPDRGFPDLVRQGLTLGLENGNFNAVEETLRRQQVAVPGLDELERIFGIASRVRTAYSATLANGLHVHMLAARALPAHLLNDEQRQGNELTFRIYYDKGRTETWWLEIGGVRLEFSLPRVLLSMWRSAPDIRRGALRIKDEFFRQIDIAGPFETMDGRRVVRHVVGVLDREFFLRALRDAGMTDP